MHNHKVGSTYSALNVHIIFGTKNREPLLREEIRGRIHEYLGGAVRTLGAQSLGVGGVEDHVHLLVGLKATQTASEVVREVKKASSRWLCDEIGMAGFHWQDGYAVISVSPERLAGVQKYVANQEEHHKKWSYREELVKLLQMAGIEPDMRYLE